MYNAFIEKNKEQIHGYKVELLKTKSEEINSYFCSAGLSVFSFLLLSSIKNLYKLDEDSVDIEMSLYYTIGDIIFLDIIIGLNHKTFRFNKKVLSKICFILEKEVSHLEMNLNFIQRIFNYIKRKIIKSAFKDEILNFVYNEIKITSIDKDNYLIPLSKFSSKEERERCVMVDFRVPIS